MVHSGLENQRPLDSNPNALPIELGRLIGRVGFKLLLYNVTLLYIALTLYVESLHNQAIAASGMCHIVFIRTENIVVDEIGRIICSHLLAHVHTYF